MATGPSSCRSTRSLTREDTTRMSALPIAPVSSAAEVLRRAKIVATLGPSCSTEDVFRKLVDAQFENGVTGIVPVGTTGESPTVTHDEHLTLVRRAVEIARGRCQVIAGAAGPARAGWSASARRPIASRSCPACSTGSRSARRSR